MFTPSLSTVDPTRPQQGKENGSARRRTHGTTTSPSRERAGSADDHTSARPSARCARQLGWVMDRRIRWDIGIGRRMTRREGIRRSRRRMTGRVEARWRVRVRRHGWVPQTSNPHRARSRFPLSSPQDGEGLSLASPCADLRPDHESRHSGAPPMGKLGML